MSAIYLVIVEDRHEDVAVYPFTEEAAALACAEHIVAERLRHPEHLDPEDDALTNDMRADGWIFLRHYSVEGECVRVVVREMNKGPAGSRRIA